jgi:hypothetical protein
MRFRIECMNPQKKRTHEFEIESDSLHDAQHQVREAGLVPTRVTPIADREPQRFTARWVPRALASASSRRGLLIRVTAYTVLTLVIVGLTSATLGLGAAGVSRQRLDGSVRFDGFQLKITNNGVEPWANVRLDINGGLAHRGYEHNVDSMASRQTIAVASTEFVDESGKRFNPITEKLVQLRIRCVLSDGTTGLYTRRWE